jgi:5-amino-6-(5-phosphoribosylamino)uracil reductase
MTSPGPRQIRRLFPEPGTTTPAEAAQELGLGEHAAGDRPWVIANLASTADGRAALGGVSGGIGNEADRLLFAAARSQVDAILVGTGTLAAERYGSVISDPAVRRARGLAGLSPQPLACVLTRSGHVPFDIPLFEDPEQVVVIYSAKPLPPEPVKARLDVVVMAEAELTFATALRDLRARHGVATVLCEGGPTVCGMLVTEGVLDELLLTFSPLFAGGGNAPRITMGPTEVDPVTGMTLRRVLEDEGVLFLHYVVAGRA